MSKYAETYRNGRVKLPVLIRDESEFDDKDPSKYDVIRVADRTEAVKKGLADEHKQFGHEDKRDAVYYDMELGFVSCPICDIRDMRMKEEELYEELFRYDDEDIVISNGYDFEVMPKKSNADDGWVELMTVKRAEKIREAIR